MGKRTLSLVCVLALCLTMLPAPALAADAPVPYLGWNAGTNSHEMASCDNYDIVTGTDTAWTSGWYVIDSDVTIDTRVTVTGDVHLILTDDGSLNAGAGITVNSGNSLTIYGQSAGTGELTAAGEKGQAGIGGEDGAAGGSITIHGGTITATGGDTGAGIGGGGGGNGGAITIHGGTVTATGGYSAAGIGGGWGDQSRIHGDTNITITGGTVVAYAGKNGSGIGDGAFYGGERTTITITGGVVTTDSTIGVGSLNAAYHGSFSTGTDGCAVIFASDITCKDYQNEWNSIVFMGNSGKVYGTELELKTDVTIPDGYTLTIPEDATLTIGDGITITNNGAIESYGNIGGTGTIANHPANERMVLALFNQAGEPKTEFIFGDEITLQASGTNLPADGETVEFFCGTYSLGSAAADNGTATLHTVIPSHNEPDVSCGSVQFQAKAGTVTGLQTARIRLQASIVSAPTVQSVTSTSVTLNQLNLSNGCDIYAPSVTCEYYNEATPESKNYSGWLTIENLQPDTNYWVRVKINQDDRYCETGYSEWITVTTAPAQTTLPAGGLELAYGPVSIEPGSESGKLSIRHNNEIYEIDSDTDIRLTGEWAGNSNRNEAAVSVAGGVNAQITLSNVVIAGSGENRLEAGISISGAAVGLTLEGDNRISGVRSGTVLFSGSTLTVVGDGSLTLGTPDSIMDFGIEGSSSSLYLNGGHLMAYGRISSNVKVEGKAAVTISGLAESDQPVSVQALGLSGGGSSVSGGWCAFIGESGTLTLYLPTDNSTYLASMLVNGQMRQFEIALGDTTTVTPVASDLSVTLPSGTQLPLEMEPDGSVRLPGGSAVQTGNGLEITVNGDEATAAPSGSVTLPSSGSATVTDDQGNTANITVSEAGGTIAPNGNGGVTLPAGSTVQAGSGPAITVTDDGAAVTPAGEVALPGGGSATVTDSNNNTTTVTMPESGGSIVPNEDGSVTLPAGSTVQTGNGPVITLPADGNGGTIVPDTGAVTPNQGGSVQIGGTTITPPSGQPIIPQEDGTVTLPGGTIVTRPDGSQTTTPESGGTVQPGGDVTYSVTVTFDSQGGSAVASQTVTVGTPAPRPADPTRDGYAFTGWYQDAACTVAWDFANSLVMADTVLYAGWNQVGGSSGGSSGSTSGSSSGGSTGSSSGVTGSGSNVSVSASGGSVTASQMESAVKKADGGAAITIKATDSSNASLPTSGLESAVENNNSLALELRYGEVTLSPETLASVAEQAGSAITLTVVPVDTDQLNSSQQAAVGDAPVFDLIIRSGSTVISDFKGGLATVSIPHELPGSQNPAGVVVWFMDDDGNITPCETMYDTSTATVLFTTRHFSKYVIGYEEPVVFTDVSEDAYYADAVLWAVANGVTNGTGATTFSPDMAVSRAQLVTFLWRACGSPEATGENPFTDVSTSDYCYDAVLWAVANGVTVGTSATTFSPDMAVTRAQAVTFQWRAAGAPVVSGGSFGDVTADAYYANAVTWAVANGITNGTGGNSFSPDVVLSRAQAVTFLWRELAQASGNEGNQ